MIISDNEYIREASFNDIETILDILQDWSLGRWPYSNVFKLVMASLNNAWTDTAPSILALFCLPDSTPIGVINWSKLEGGNIDIHVIAIHRDYRGQGHFSRFATLLGEVLPTIAQEANFIVLPEAPQVSQWTKTRGGETIKNQGQREFILVKKEVYEAQKFNT